jgi:uracil-DNA glycosylase
VLKSIQRLGVDPMAIFGTNYLKYEDEDEEEARSFLVRELYVVQPKLIVVMGQDAVQCLNATRFPLASELEEMPGTLQRFTPTIEALVTPDLDASLDEQGAKKAFWEAFRAIGPWFSELPPY